ncbi:MAG: prepilin peptidase, partial [Pirellulales bacterium]|nr:prepilin peptidase [Pirellulales bacterium]
ELTTLEILRIRSAKFVVFAIFAYFGACVGSFLNVVASSAPRGESIGFRSSACPQCDIPIRRFDNLPIVSFLLLGGRCRNCKIPIPFRYLGVELVATAIFASLFLFELVTGAANVPGFQHYHYTGILWIILYTKWPVVGIYFYHAAMFSCMLMFALMEADQLRCPRFMSVAVVGVFACLAIVAPVLQPVVFDDQLPMGISESIPPRATAAITCFVGGSLGWLIALVANRLSRQAPPTVSLILLGVTLGWQATITIALIWTITSVATSRIRRPFQPIWMGPTAVLFASSMLHHPAWKWLAQLW